MKDIEDNHRAYRLLEEISKGDPVTQRDLSQRSGIALGLVNLYIKNLVQKGYIKVSGIPRKRYKYYLTPKGFREKTRLTLDLVGNYTKIFREARREYALLFETLKAEGETSVVFAGLDDVAEIAYLSLQEAGLKLVGASDNAPLPELFFGTPLYTFAELAAAGLPGAVVVTTYRRRDEVIRALIAAGVPKAGIRDIYPLP